MRINSHQIINKKTLVPKLIVVAPNILSYTFFDPLKNVALGPEHGVQGAQAVAQVQETLFMVKENTSEISGIITAQGKDSESQPSGFSFVNCNISGTEKIWKVFDTSSHVGYL
ncbi:hypothetical protein IGI04_018047 [Brassica rapa subsp. trilocularis]|uniref:Pectinesterase n=1 Tax=Brassica rapa subsp. trilocularis TaxID=1813537 RepID=A0ABQ7MBT0_BRACM|nr:hypothetical protein IGI04_018047 [Brassica rapa subsp. trilocularis]